MVASGLVIATIPGKLSSMLIAVVPIIIARPPAKMRLRCKMRIVMWVVVMTLIELAITLAALTRMMRATPTTSRLAAVNKWKLGLWNQVTRLNVCKSYSRQPTKQSRVNVAMLQQ